MARRDTTGETRVPKRLYAAVPTDQLVRTLLEGGLAGAQLTASKRKARHASGAESAVVTIFPREAERDEIAFSPDGDAWAASVALAPHHLGCRDDRALAALRVKRKVSAGGLIVSSLEEARVMLMFRRHGDATAWKTPKGGIATGETRKEAARRETAEESGIDRVDVVSYLGRIQYFKPHHKRVMSEKTVHIYLMRSLDGEVQIAPREGERFVSCDWLTVDEAIDRVTQPQMRRLIARAGRRLGVRGTGAASA